MILKKTALILIGVYRTGISPFLGARCRFMPTCSAYGQEAFQIHPFHKALWMTVGRVCRCHPFNGEKGFCHDPVPPVK
jgi:uncharacterized protein